jgi:hypothetical protein
MHPLIGTCPVCGETLEVTRLHCRNCDTSLEGHFNVGVFERLGPEQLAFAEKFIYHEGKLNRMEADLGLSYPTLRSRLLDLRRAMGFEIDEDEEAADTISDETRRQILDDLAAGKISLEESMQRLQGG